MRHGCESAVDAARIALVIIKWPPTGRQDAAILQLGVVADLQHRMPTEQYLRCIHPLQPCHSQAATVSWSTGDAWLETREHDERRPITCFDHPIVTTAEPKPIVRDRPLRWIGLTIGVAISAVDMVIASVLGITFAISDSDATTAVWAYLAVSFGVLGYLIGWLMESRRREQHAVARVREQMNTLRGLQIGLAEREKLAALGQLAATIAHEAGLLPAPARCLYCGRNHPELPPFRQQSAIGRREVPDYSVGNPARRAVSFRESS